MLREEFMKPLAISINGLALDLHVPVTRISESAAASPPTRRFVSRATSARPPLSGWTFKKTTN
jgi:hypothetical protein